MFQEVKRKGTGELKRVEEQLLKGAKKYFEKCGGNSVYGMTGWGTRARVWIIERTSGHHYCMRHLYFGAAEGAHRDSYVDADSDWAYYISCFTADIKGEDPPEMLQSLQQLASAYQGQ